MPARAGLENAGVRQVPLTCPGHSRPVRHFAFSDETPDGVFLVSACNDYKPMLRDGRTGDWIGTLEGHKGAVWAATITKDATRIATASADYTAKLWDAVSGAELASLTHKRIVKSVDFSRDGARLVTGSADKLVQVFRTAEPNAAPMQLEGHTGAVRQALWSDDDATIVSGGSDKEVRFWDVRTGKQTRSLPVSAEITSLDVCRSGSLLCVTYGRTAAWYDYASLAPIRSYDLNLSVECAALHDSLPVFVAGGSGNNWVHVCDWETGEPLIQHKVHHGPVHWLRFAPGGDMFASGSDDGTVRLWMTNPPVPGDSAA